MPGPHKDDTETKQEQNTNPSFESLKKIKHKQNMCPYRDE